MYCNNYVVQRKLEGKNKAKQNKQQCRVFLCVATFITAQDPLVRGDKRVWNTDMSLFPVLFDGCSFETEKLIISFNFISYGLCVLKKCLIILNSFLISQFSGQFLSWGGVAQKWPPASGSDVDSWAFLTILQWDIDVVEPTRMLLRLLRSCGQSRVLLLSIGDL